MTKKLTFRDIARAAKVSVATVSRVMAGNNTVDPSIRDRVRKTAEHLGMDLEERRRGTSRIIAFLLGNRDMLHAFQSRVLHGAATYCSSQNWELLFIPFHYSPDVPPDALHLPQLMGSQPSARSVILAGVNSSNLLSALRAKQIPFTVLGNNVLGEWNPDECDVAFVDDVGGAYEATKHLIAEGHTAIGFLANLHLPWFRRCAEGYKRAMAEAGRDPRFIDFRSDGSQLGYLAAKSFLAKRGSITAVLAGTDQIASGVYDACRESGVSIPNDLSVVGINDTQGALFYPPLTSVREFPEEVGRYLAEFALRRVATPDSPPQQITIPTQLVKRDSVRPVVTPSDTASRQDAAASALRSA